MPRNKTPKALIPLIRGAIDTFVIHPVIFLPYLIIAFIQLLILEILYFAPRFPLSGFFNPIVRTIWGEEFIHYPNNFVILPKLFQYAQVPLYIFVSSFLIAVSIASIALINDGEHVKFSLSCRKVLPQYVHIFVGALLLFSCFYGLNKLYGLMIIRALQISSTSGAEAGARQVIITFDDGEMNNYEQALPVLRKCGFPAYFFIIAKRIGEAGYMGWDELRALHQAGMIIGSHGFSHEILTNLLDTQIDEELRASKRYLERNLQIAVDAFSMPRGFCNNKVIRMAYAAGYKYVFISDRPRALELECLSRVAVKANWPIKRFEQAITGETPVHERMVGKGKSADGRDSGQ